MSWYSRLYSWVADAAAGTAIDATRMDAEFNGVETALNKCLTADGSNPAAANIPMGGFKLTGLANGSAATDSVAYGQVSGLLNEWRTESATIAYVSATSLKVTGDVSDRYRVGQRIRTTNTGGTVYSTVLSSSYLAPATTVSVVNDSGSLDSGLSALAYGMLDSTYRSSPVGSSAYYYRSSNQAYTAVSGLVQVTLNVTLFDLLNERSISQFLPKTSGTYLVAGGVRFQQTGAGVGAPGVSLYVSGSSAHDVVAQDGVSYGAGTQHYRSFLRLMRISGSAPLTLYVQSALDGSIVGGQDSTFLSIQRVL